MDSKVKFDVWDNEDRTADRYSIAVIGDCPNGIERVYFWHVSERPNHPQGVAWYGEELSADKYSPDNYTHLGKKIQFTELPEAVCEFVIEGLNWSSDNDEDLDFEE